MTRPLRLLLCLHLALAAIGPVAAVPANGDGRVVVSGELKQWHKVTLDLAGPYARENDTTPNPFTDYRFNVSFTHESGTPSYVVPGYFAADGNAGESGAEAGNVWRAHLSPDKPGRWTYRVAFLRGPGVATSDGAGEGLAPFDGRSGSFDIAPTDKSGRDFRAKGRLQYVGGHHLRFAGSGEYFLKAGPDSPETFLGATDFDNTIAGKPDVPLKTWAPHVRDWREGDPTWRDGRGKGLIGALNYLAEKGLNSFSFLPYNAGGDGDNVWPFVAREDKLHYDCSKLDQWEIVFAHAQRLGLYLHFKLQETENDDQRRQRERAAIVVPEALDGGATGAERKLYLREIIARFGHHLALNWNLGEENTQTPEEQRAMAQFIADTDPYGHLRVIHSYPNEQERVYEPLLGARSALTGASLQNMWHDTHARTVQWIKASAAAGKPWVVANDEQGSARSGVPPDPGYRGFDGIAVEEGYPSYDLHGIRRFTLWGSLMAGGAGVEYYFGYRLAENDLVAEDFRSRDQSWDYCRIALEFFAREQIPFWMMRNGDELVGNPAHGNSRYCLVLPDQLYLVYLPHGGEATLDLAGVAGDFDLRWFNPRNGALQPSVQTLAGDTAMALIAPDQEDWIALIRARRNTNTVRAFPGAEGFGAYAKGGRGGRVLHVTNLNDSGPGSLRWAVGQEGPRTIVFEVSGTIELKTGLDIANPFLTIAGQTAPGDGICLKGETVRILTHDVVMRYLRFRLGDGRHGQGSLQGKDALSLSKGADIIVDHCSASWSLDEVLSASTHHPDLTRVTVQWCFITEALNPSNHGYGSLIRGTGGAKYSFLRNLYAHNFGRNPRPGNYNTNPHGKDPEGLLLDFRNNVIYNWGGRHAGYNQDSVSVTRLNYVGNYLIPGADSQPTGIAYLTGSPFNRAYFAGNAFDGKVPEDPWTLVRFRETWAPENIRDYKQTRPFETGPVTTDEAAVAFERVLLGGGATLPKRDPVDLRVVDSVRQRSGRIIPSQENVGGWPVLNSAPAPQDTDRDGMPDAWERAHGLNPADPADGNSVGADGYTRLENYLNGLCASTESL
jgi:hypothetical protein